MSSHNNDCIQYEPTDNCLSKKKILITGAGDGIGRAVSIACAKYGATVILLGRTLAKLEAVYDTIEQARYPQPAIYPMNFEGSTEHDYETMLSVIEEEFGHLDGILHNAGELGPRTPIKNYSLAEWEKVLHVNITGPFALTKILMPALEKSDSASIVMTGSDVGLKGRAYWGAYAVSKAATENFVQVLADELDGTGNIRINSINPGATRTNMRALAYPAEDPTTQVSPDDIVNRYIFLFSNESKHISGQQFNAQNPNR